MNKADPINPIATYRELRFEGNRAFELFPDRVRIRGKIQLSSDFEISIPLDTLNPAPTRIRVRNRAFWSGLWLLLAGFILDAVLISGFHISAESFAVVLVGCIGMGGFVLMLATARKVEFVSFATNAGVHVLDLARSGPDAPKLDSFVQLISATIADATKGKA